MNFLPIFDEPHPDPRKRLEISIKKLENYIRGLAEVLDGLPETKEAWEDVLDSYVSGSLRRRLRVRILKNFVGEPYFGFFADGRQLFNGRC